MDTLALIMFSAMTSVAEAIFAAHPAPAERPDHPEAPEAAGASAVLAVNVFIGLLPEGERPYGPQYHHSTPGDGT